MWTHRNGNGPNAAVQQIDFVFASTPLARQIGMFAEVFVIFRKAGN